MYSVWQKFKLWTKAILLAAALLYGLIFIYNNSGEAVRLWWWYNRRIETSAFFLTIGAFLSGIVTTILVRTLWTTWRQISKSSDRARTDKLEREVATMKAKAAMLQTRPDVDPNNSRIV
jgi:hypothetical protein